jgi:hypothetical protein
MWRTFRILRRIRAAALILSSCCIAVSSSKLRIVGADGVEHFLWSFLGSGFGVLRPPVLFIHCGGLCGVARGCTALFAVHAFAVFFLVFVPSGFWPGSWCPCRCFARASSRYPNVR